VHTERSERHHEIENLLHNPDMALRSLSDLKRLLPVHRPQAEPIPNANAMHSESLTTCLLYTSPSPRDS